MPIVSQIDDIIRRLEECDRLSALGTLFSTSNSHLWVHNEELADVLRLTRLAVSGRYGMNSPQEKLLLELDGGGNTDNSEIRKQIIWLRRVRGFVIGALPDESEVGSR